MDFHNLSRKELQVLCKSHGIPANRSNIFMAEALANKRIPLSQMDANRGQKKLNFPPEKSYSSDEAGTKKDLVKAERKEKSLDQYKFKNNFLRRGTRKDTKSPTKSLAALESDVSQDTLRSKDDFTSRGAASNFTKSNPAGLDVGKRDVGNLSVGRLDVGGPDVETPNDGTPNDVGRQDFTRSDVETVKGKCELPAWSAVATAKSGIDYRERTHSVGIATGDGKKRLVAVSDRVRSQVEDSLCSKVVHANVQRHTEPLAVKELEVTGPASPSRHEALDDCMQETLGGQAKLEATPFQHDHSPELVASPPLKFSPLLLLVEEKLRNAIEKVRKFWGRDMSTMDSVSLSPGKITE